MACSTRVFSQQRRIDGYRIQEDRHAGAIRAAHHFAPLQRWQATMTICSVTSSSGGSGWPVSVK